ncbi:hypothetical protein [Roseisolibacter agri]|uniref:Uncharacterized protein n=1 Tax=Roseisolibacter agri TaxID=2014610 RepID=A0AA37V9W9_9BACT|nr:hypothetical protein [Roseisolibacter agri]GLC24838.1 hypothetical protein rosag_13510 [Roseisolibacter agri]
MTARASDPAIRSLRSQHAGLAARDARSVRTGEAPRCVGFVPSFDRRGVAGRYARNEQQSLQQDHIGAGGRTRARPR